MTDSGAKNIVQIHSDIRVRLQYEKKFARGMETVLTFQHFHVYR